MVWIDCGLAQISRAYGQRAKSPTRAVAALLARVKIYYNPHPYGLDSLWFGSIMAWLKSHEPSARGPSRQGAALLARITIYYNLHPYGLD